MAIMSRDITIAATIPSAPTGGRKPDTARRNSDGIAPTCIGAISSHANGSNGNVSMSRPSTAEPNAEIIAPIHTETGTAAHGVTTSSGDTGKAYWGNSSNAFYNSSFHTQG